MITGKKKYYYSVDEVKEVVFSGRLSTSTLRKMIMSGQIPTLKLNRRYFIPKWWVDKQIMNALGTDTLEESDTDCY